MGCWLNGVFRTTLGLVLCWHIGGCTDAVLIAVTDPGHVSLTDNKVDLTGTACTVEPGAVLYPYKILFVIDVSGSNNQTDPNDNRARAAQQVIEDYIENRAVSFGVVTFSDEAQAQLMSFTRDYGILVPGVVDTMKKKMGSTNYLGALSETYDFIEEDIMRMPESLRHRTRYDIQWLSDGVPQPCITVQSAVSGVRNIMKLEELYALFDIKLHTVQLMGGGGGGGCPDGGPDVFLSAMAEEGDGSFQQMTSEELEFAIHFTEIFRAFEQRQFFLVNENRVVWQDDLWPDSDGDGLRDEHDHEIDPIVADFNTDGCSDRVDEQMFPEVDLCPLTCAEEMEDLGGIDWTELPDIDMDGLPNCAEKVMGFNWGRIDTDLDGFPDWVELKFRTNAIQSAPFDEDNDQDGVSDGDEIRQGTNPRFPETDDVRQVLAYEYGSLEPTSNIIEGTSCFTFEILNVRLTHTRETATAPEGTNRLCVYLSQTPMDEPYANRTVTLACKTARYLQLEEEEVKIPAAGVLEFQPDDFSVTPLGIQNR